MKYIFDFDDVIFQTTRHRLECMFSKLEQAGASRNQIEEYYARTRLTGFSLKDAIRDLASDKNIDAHKLYDEIMDEAKKYTNTELIEFIKTLGKENCFLITHGGDEFQKDKIARAGVSDLFSKIIILIGSKKSAIEEICEKYKNEQVIFIDDKPQYFEDLDLRKCPNLRTILYKWQSIEKLKRQLQV